MYINIKMYIKKTYSIFITILFFSLACGGGGGGSNSSYSQPKGSLVINISNSSHASSKVIIPNGDLTAHSYSVTGTGPAGATFSRIVTDETSVEIQGLVIGEWLIHVEALNEGGVSIGDGEVTITVESGETILTNINLIPFEGMGVLELTVNWAATVTDPSLDIRLSRKGYLPSDIPYQLNPITNFAEVNQEVDSGYYTLTVDLYENNGGTKTRIGGAVEIVRVTQGMTSSKTIAITNAPSVPDSGIRNEFPVSAGAAEGNDALSSFSNGTEASNIVNGLPGARFVSPPGPNNFGTISLSYPIAVPLGRGGIGPKVSLTYSSSTGDGLVGSGWKLSAGLGSISRSPNNGPIYYDSRDTFTYNDNRLVKIDGPANSENGTYRLEIESEFSRFELSGIETGGTWRVYDKSGAVSTYGVDNSSRMYHPQNPNKVYSWLFCRLENLNGNYVQAIYNSSGYSSDHMSYIKEIRYTGNTGIYGTALPARQYVRFHMKDRDDGYVTKAPGFIVKMNKLLDKIEVGWDDPNGSNNTELWSYKMVYENSKISGRPLLKTVESNHNSTKPEFIYENKLSSLEWRKISNPDFNSNTDPDSVKYFQGDFNGDGISDIAFFNSASGNWKVMESSFNGGFNFRAYGNLFAGYDTQEKIQFFKDNATGDYDGNGRSDIAFYLPETNEIWVAESTGRNFEFHLYGIVDAPNLDIFKCEWFTGDFDGNGLPDIVLYDESSGEWIFMRNKFRSFDFTIFSEHFMNLFRDDYNPDMNMDGTFTTDTTSEGKARDKVHFIMGDFNGDARSDISFYDSRDGKWWVGETQPLDSTGISKKKVNFTLEWKLYKEFNAPEMALFSDDFFTGDFNSDGFSDFLLFDKDNRKWMIGETKEDTIQFRILTGMPSAAGNVSFWIQGDFNGDERTDIGFLSDDNKFWVGEATNEGFRYRIYNDFASSMSPTPELLRTYGTRWIQGDFNGDNKTDVGIFNLNEPDWYFAVTSTNKPDIITEVKNGIGGTYYIEYEDAVSRDNTGDDNIPDLPINYKICTKITVDDGLGEAVTTRYDYKNAYSFCKFINGEKESDYFGFEEFSIISPAGQKSIYYYHNVPYDDYRKNRALAGALKSTRFIGNDGIEYSRTENDYIIREIVPFGAAQGTMSYLVDAVKKRNYNKGILVSTTESNIALVPGEYEISSITTKATDHYKDGIHTEASISSYQEFATVKETNETRLMRQKGLAGTTYETESEFIYDNRGNLIREITRAKAGSPRPADQVFEYEYDAYGNRVRTINKSGTPWRIANSLLDNKMHQFLVESRVQKGQGANDYLSTTYVLNYGAAFGSPLKITGANGNSSYFQYDSLGRLTRSSADTDTGVETIAEYFYDSDFPMSAKTIKYSGTGEGNLSARIYTDGMGRTIHSVRSGPGTSSGNRYIKSGLQKYDSAGRLTAVGQTYWADDDEIDNFKKGSVLKYPTYYFYDEAGRQRKIIAPKAYENEQETSVTYTYNDPWEIIETHSSGRIKRIITNGRGETLYVEDKGTGDDGKTINAKMGFAYNIIGSVEKKIDLPSSSSGFQGMSLNVDPGLFQLGSRDTSGSNICAWKYNAFGQLIASSDPDLGYAEYEYNDFGAPVARTDALGRTVRLSYDPMGRLTRKTLPGNEGTIDYIYDQYQGSENAKGRLAMIADRNQGKVFSYDRLGRRKTETRFYLAPDLYNLPEKPYETNYTHDLFGRTTRIDYPADPRYNTRTAVNYTYNSMGLAQTVKAEYGNGEEKTLVSGIEYNEFGQIIAVTNGNGVRNEYSYDIKGRLNALFSSSVKNNQVQYLQNVRYLFNTDNSLKSIENNPTEGVGLNLPRNTRNNYVYDGLNRLVSATGLSENSLNTDPKKFRQDFSFSSNGNLLRKDIVDADSGALIDRWDYEYVNHAVTSINTTQFGVSRFEMEYDAVGNLISETDNEKNLSKVMDYNSSNRITQVTDGNTNEVTGKYWYDTQGLRVARISKHDFGEGKKEYAVYYPSKFMGIEIERDQNGIEVPGTYTVVNNIYLNGQRIAAMLPCGETQYYQTDQVDSVKLVVDDHAMVKSRHEYLPYGETWFTEGTDDIAPSFGSRELDEESGLYFFGARHYDPTTGVFASADSMIDGASDTQGWNRYAYCKGNPVGYLDPTGHGVVKKVAKDIRRAVVDSVTFKYTYKEGGKKGVAAAIFFPGGPCGIRYNKSAGWSIRAEVVNYYGAYIGWGWQQKGYHKGFNVFTGGGYNWGCVSVGGSGTYYFGSKTMGNNVGLSVGNKYGSIGIGYYLEHDMNGNVVSHGIYGTGEVNKMGIAMQASGLNQRIANLQEGKTWDGQSQVEMSSDSPDLYLTMIQPSMNLRAAQDIAVQYYLDKYCFERWTYATTNHQISTNGDYGAIRPGYPSHSGIDQAPITPKVSGDNIFFTEAGKISRMGWQNPNNVKEGYGQYIEVENVDGSISRYGHMRSFSPELKPGDTVLPFQYAGRMGNTGLSFGPHLHYEELWGGQPITPHRKQ